VRTGAKSHATQGHEFGLKLEPAEREELIITMWLRRYRFLNKAGQLTMTSGGARSRAA
jgi:hypothetical protein